VPQVVKYKAKSIIYFEGDISDKIYILQSGKVSLISVDIENGQELREMVKTGEFFGVKSSLGRYPREETADVLADSVVMVFTIPEFENLIYTNPRINMQMLKVFSNQLRRLHKKVRSLMSIDEQTDAETGLFNIGEYYYKNQKFKPALYAFRRYLTYYPAGIWQGQATDYLIKIEKYPQGGAPAGSLNQKAQTGKKPSAPEEESKDSKLYYDGLGFFSQEKYEDAINNFRQYISANPDGEFMVRAVNEIGKSFFLLKRYDDCIKHFTGMIQKFPKHPDLPEFLLYLGLSCDAKGDKQRAAGFYKKVITMCEDGSEVKRKAKNALKTLGGN
jgi:TolA-binding protein